MKVTRIENSYIQENTYFIYEGNTCLIVDPGSDFEHMDSFIVENSFENIYIYLTHGHHDHIISVQPLQDKYNCNVYIHELELDLLKNPNKNMSASSKNVISIDNAIGVKDIIDIPSFDLKVYHVPGHTSGHSMLEVKKLNALFTGDFVFYHEIGRCDLPTGNLQEMYNSLDKLVLMDPKLLIYPGHGQSSTVAEEIKNNRYINR